MSFSDAIAFNERWQATSHEYVEPPTPLKDYLLWNWSFGV